MFHLLIFWLQIFGGKKRRKKNLKYSIGLNKFADLYKRHQQPKMFELATDVRSLLKCIVLWVIEFYEHEND